MGGTGRFINVYNAMFAPDNCTSNLTDVNGAFVCPGGGGALPGSEAWASQWESTGHRKLSLLPEPVPVAMSVLFLVLPPSRANAASW